MKLAISIIYIALFAWVIALLPTACDTEYATEHPTDVYISPADDVVINWNNEIK